MVNTKVKKRIFYPLTPIKGKYKEPKTASLAVCLDYMDFVAAAGVNEYGNLHLLPTKKHVATWINHLPPNAWIITFDVGQYIPALAETLIQDVGSISGIDKSTIVLEIIKDDYKYYLVDLRIYYLTTLQNILSGLDLEQLPRPGENYTLKDWQDYTKLKALRIYEAWTKTRDIVKEYFGIHISKTPGATGLRTYRTKMTDDIKKKGRGVTELTREAIYPGALHWRQGYYQKAFLYDINAAYPFVMGNYPYPKILTAFTGNPPSSNWIATARLDYKTNRPFSPYCVKLPGGGMVRPEEVYNHTATLTHVDYMLLKLTGTVKIHEFIEGVYWKDNQQDYIFRQWYETIKKACEENPVNKFVLKVLSRALHSKFAQVPGMVINQYMQVHPRQVRLYVAEPGVDVTQLIPMENGGLMICTQQRLDPTFKSYDRPDLEALTLSYARLYLYSVLDENTIYADTDGFISTTERTDLDIGAEFGQWKEVTRGEAYILGPRYYIVGNRVRASGINPANFVELKKALQLGAIGEVSVIEALENHNIFSRIENPTGTRLHTIKAKNYPRALVDTRDIYITASPTIAKKLTLPRRLLTREMTLRDELKQLTL